MTLHHIIFDIIPFADAFNICSVCALACSCLFSFSKSLIKQVFVSQYFYYALLSYYTSYPSDNSIKSGLNLKFYSLYIDACKLIDFDWIIYK